ncbi:peptidase M48, Ste24p [Candidatus Koribacter versatilis Ellin345]|uniref:Peptidase M48, Ste24p n=1 Tax=Koribacter versatilis (strain Ellin345) TaxID=204669 RepID=Q1IT14_KORVE|nr:M48 family metallopeptidase [Candidatus Koribacter versatilis]ABF39986.1 peptidase M48, Ste24p [Candidatus Koribacter versatilis Ellin345]
MGLRRLVAFLLLSTASLFSQTAPVCTLPAIQVKSAPGNIFTEAQENQLGDVVVDQSLPYITIIHDETLARPLREIGAKLIAQLPTTMTYHFDVIELDEANAFSLPGGHIYVSRKLIALTQTEDELAAVLAHELGHEVTHQGAATFSRLFATLLGVHQVTTADDIRHRYNQMLDLQASKKVKLSKEEDDQLDADAVAIQALARAGYSASAFASMFDRVAETHGGKSSFFADLFGMTKPNTARFRKIQKTIATLPTECSTQRATGDSFAKWRTSIIEYDPTAAAEAHAPGLLWQKKLTPALRPGVKEIQYSSDGRYLLIQDSGAIHVATRDPLKEVFQIPAQRAYPAKFSLDGQRISFYMGNGEPRIEVWSVADQKRVEVHELHVKQRECPQSELSADGKVFACIQAREVSDGVYFDLVLYDVSNGAELLRFPKIRDATGWNAYVLLRQYTAVVNRHGSFELVSMHFSPDGHWLVAAFLNRMVAFDLTQRTKVEFPPQIAKLLGNSFVFLSPDRVLVSKFVGASSADVRSFPGGDLIKPDILIGAGWVRPTEDPNHVLVGPLDDYPLGIVDINTNKVALRLKGRSANVWKDEFAMERTGGDLSVNNLPDAKEKALLHLSDSQLGSVDLGVISGDLSWIAYTEGARGGVWNLATGERAYHLRDFNGAYFAGDTVHADMPKFEKSPRVIAHMKLPGSAVTTNELPGDDHFLQYGPIVLAFRSGKIGRHPKDEWYDSEVTQVRGLDVATLKELWTEPIAKRADAFHVHSTGDTFVIERDEKDVVNLEFQQLSTGKPLAKLAIKTNKHSFNVIDAVIAGDYLIVADDQSRSTIYKTSGEEVARVFGGYIMPSAKAGVLAVQSEEQGVFLYELATGKKIDTLQLGRPIVYYNFDSTGEKLFVLTSDQVAYAFDVEKLKTSATTGAN